MGDLLLSFGAYAGAGLLLAAVAVIVRSRWRPSSAARRRALRAAVTGTVLCAVAWLWPTPLVRTAADGSSAIDRAMPAYQFVERHETPVQASPRVVFDAIRSVTADEIRYFRTLTWIRNPGRYGREDILAAPPDKPLLDVAVNGGFWRIEERPDREIVLGTRVARGVHAVINFEVTPVAAGVSRVSTETRVRADDPASLRAFTLYWRVIYPGSALIRVEWLRAIRRRAEAAHDGRVAESAPLR